MSLLKPETKEEQLTVGALKKLLSKYPDNMPVIYSCYSAWTPMHEQDITTLEGLDKGGYVDIPYRAKDNPLLKTFLAFPGN